MSKKSSIYSKNLLHRKISIPIHLIGSNLINIINMKLKKLFEGKCSKEGYIKNDSIQILTYSSGVLEDNLILFDVSFECLICRPVEGMRFRVIAKNVTKAGVRCETKEEISPVVVFIARDHHFKSKDFANIKVDDEITVRVIGIRFELNDKYISVIAEFIPTRKVKKRPKIVISKKA